MKTKHYLFLALSVLVLSSCSCDRKSSIYFESSNGKELTYYGDQALVDNLILCPHDVIKIKANSWQTWGFDGELFWEPYEFKIVRQTDNSPPLELRNGISPRDAEIYFDISLLGIPAGKTSIILMLNIDSEWREVDRVSFRISDISPVNTVTLQKSDYDKVNSGSNYWAGSLNDAPVNSPPLELDEVLVAGGAPTGNFYKITRNGVSVGTYNPITSVFTPNVPGTNFDPNGRWMVTCTDGQGYATCSWPESQWINEVRPITLTIRFKCRLGVN